MRSRAPPVADAARRSTRSGRKNRASEQRDDFFGHRKAVGADAPAATLGAYLCAVRTMLLHRSYPALQATERGLSRGNLSPLTRFCLLLAVQKEAPAGQAYSLCLCKRLRDADRRDEIWYKGGRGARVRDYIFPRGNPAGRRKKLAPAGLRQFTECSLTGEGRHDKMKLYYLY